MGRNRWHVTKSTRKGYSKKSETFLKKGNTLVQNKISSSRQQTLMPMQNYIKVTP